jgi:hypothetical protein
MSFAEYRSMIKVTRSDPQAPHLKEKAAQGDPERRVRNYSGLPQADEQAGSIQSPPSAHERSQNQTAPVLRSMRHALGVVLS